MVMPFQQIRESVRGAVPLLQTNNSDYPIGDDQIQPASIDLRLGTRAYAMWSAALPQCRSIEEHLVAHSKFNFEIKDTETAHLDKGQTYIIPMMEECLFPPHVRMECSPKSSTGRNDVFVRVLSDGGRYDRVPSGYNGKLYLEVTPLSFSVGVRPGLSLTQGRLKTDQTRALTESDLRRLHTAQGLVFDFKGEPKAHNDISFANGRILFHIDLDRPIVGFEARENVPRLLDLTQKEWYDPRDFWVPIYRPSSGQYTLTPDKFCLLATKERIRIPVSCSGEMLAYEVPLGEVRPHYAGFFDNGFGGDRGTNGVMEVRGRELSFLLEDGQEICAMAFEETFEVPSQTYEGHYTQTGPSLSKHFKHRYEAWTPDYWRSV